MFMGVLRFLAFICVELLCCCPFSSAIAWTFHRDVVLLKQRILSTNITFQTSTVTGSSASIIFLRDAVGKKVAILGSRYIFLGSSAAALSWISHLGRPSITSTGPAVYSGRDTDPRWELGTLYGRDMEMRYERRSAALLFCS